MLYTRSEAKRASHNNISFLYAWLGSASSGVATTAAGHVLFPGIRVFVNVKKFTDKLKLYCTRQGINSLVANTARECPLFFQQMTSQGALNKSLESEVALADSMIAEKLSAMLWFFSIQPSKENVHTSL